MTKEEFKQARQDLGLRGQELAKRLGEPLKNIIAYESGSKRVPDGVAKYLKAITINLKAKKND